MAITMALMCSLLWGVADFAGGIAARRINVVLVVGLAQVFGLLTVLGYGFAMNAQWVSAAVAPGILAAIGGDIGLLAFYRALAIGRMGIVSPIAAFGAVVPMVVGLVSGDRPTTWQLIGMVIGVAGVVLASGPELSGGADAKPVLLAIVAALGFGFALVGMAAGANLSLYTTATTMRIFTVTIFVVALAIAPRLRGKVIGWRLIAVSGAFDVAANLAFGWASTRGMLSIISILGSLYPVITAGLAWALLHERLLKIQYLGAGLTLAGVFAMVAG